MNHDSPSVCGLDFGTSNSGVSVPARESVRLVELEGDATSMPSAVFFAIEENQPVLYGRQAVDEYLDGTPGRLMRSLKSVLGSVLMHETTSVGARTLGYDDIITLYLRTVRDRACARVGTALDSVVLGRPVRFDDDDLARDRDAQAALEGCARDAGFRHVEFQLEPIAAAFDYERTIEREEIVLVIDVGGGTADFSVIRLAPDRRDAVSRTGDVLASDGVHVAGTDFDSRLNLVWVMPVLGYGSTGPKGLPVPSAVYFDLSTWHRINLLYSPRFLGPLRELQAFFVDLVPYRRLVRVVEQRLGHQLLGETERAKIALSEHARARVDLAGIEAGLVADVSRAELIDLLDDLLARLVRVAKATIAAAGLDASDMSTLYFTGGSSGMRPLREAFAAAFPDSRAVVGDLFGSVVSGLGIDAARRFA
ncbi:MAG: Hsp70 family protein [Betaproteobacteria bacterium]